MNRAIFTAFDKMRCILPMVTQDTTKTFFSSHTMSSPSEISEVYQYLIIFMHLLTWTDFPGFTSDGQHVIAKIPATPPRHNRSASGTFIQCKLSSLDYRVLDTWFFKID